MQNATTQDKIIDLIRRNRISSTEVADCLGKTGAIPGIRPINKRHFAVGKVFWAFASYDSNWELHKRLRDAPDDSIVIIEAIECDGRAVMGSLVSKFLILYRQVRAIVIRGLVRDVPHIIRENWPVWSEGATPIGCRNDEPKSAVHETILKQMADSYDGAIAVCDDTGVTIIPKNVQDESFIDKLNAMEELEDIWFDCIDRRKFDTFDTVCLKKYLESK
jgi:4-hydroxy-4-methyl-2-oxoglutarate aldolase